jgi:hypothetical protein
LVCDFSAHAGFLTKRKVNKDNLQYIRKNVQEAPKLKRTSFILMISVFVVASITILAPRNACAASPSPVRVDMIDHAVAPLYGGLLLINDTVRITPTAENTTIENFRIGFSLEYEKNLCYSTAYDAENTNERLDVVANTGLGTVGYYGVTVNFPSRVRDLLYNGQSYTFTVVFVFSGTITSSTSGANATTMRYVFTADFPAFPSLVQNATACNVTVDLPKNMTYDSAGLPFNVTQKQQGGYYLNYTKSSLQALTRTSTRVSFSSESKNAFACFSTNKLNREITIDADGGIFVSDTFVLESQNVFTADNIRMLLPRDVESVAAYDEIGETLDASLFQNETDLYQISLSLVAGQFRSFRLTYNLLKESHLTPLEGNSLLLNLSLSENLKLVAKTFTLKIVFPEGATIQSFPSQAMDVKKDVFQETLSLHQSNVTWLQNEQWSITYSHTVFWNAFRPTLWATAIVIIGSVVAFMLQRPKAPVSAVSTIMVARKILNDFVDTYEEKKKAQSDLEQIKRKAVKGRVSRREYKVRKTTLENQLSSLTKKLADSRQKIASGGAKYADTMRQLEVAETELDNIEADIRRIEVRFKGGDISALTYHHLLEEDLKRKDKAKTTIDGVLLRLKE